MYRHSYEVTYRVGEETARVRVMADSMPQAAFHVALSLGEQFAEDDRLIEFVDVTQLS